MFHRLENCTIQALQEALCEKKHYYRHGITPDFTSFRHWTGHSIEPLPDSSLHKTVWQTVANPGAILKGGRIAGVWRTRTQKERLEISITLFEKFSPPEHQNLTELAEEYAAFRHLTLKNCVIG